MATDDTPIDQFRRVFQVPLVRTEKPVGLGTVVENVTRKVGIKPCAPCARRKKWLNERFAIQGRAKKA